MKKNWAEPNVEFLSVQATEMDIKGDGAPDGLKVSAKDPTDCGWINHNCKKECS